MNDLKNTYEELYQWAYKAMEQNKKVNIHLRGIIEFLLELLDNDCSAQKKTVEELIKSLEAKGYFK